jgi:thioredoxin reductase
MTEKTVFEVIIIGGSYSGLSAAMALGRSMREVLVLDSALPCNRQTLHAHNLITQDGNKPQEISALAKEQVLNYPTIQFIHATASGCRKVDNGFEISLNEGKTFRSKKILFATGVKDDMANIEGFAECWGISVLHCPYCHGYEVKGKKLGIIANGDIAFEFCKLISNWSSSLILFTDGEPTLTKEQREKLEQHNIIINENKIDRLIHTSGHLKNIVLQGNNVIPMDAIFSRVSFKQHCSLPAVLGCAITKEGLIEIDMFQKTTVPGIYAAGDATTMFRAISMAIASGSIAGAVINKDIIEENF